MMKNQELLKSVFKGYYSRSITGMQLYMREMYSKKEIDLIIWDWIKEGEIWGTWTNDDHFFIPSEEDRKRLPSRQKQVNQV